MSTTTRTGRSNALREVEVALVVRGHGHDRAGAVVGQHVVGGVDRHLLAVDRVDRDDAEVDAGLRPLGGLPVDVGELAHLLEVGVELGPLLGRAHLGGQRRVGGDDEEGRAVQRVRPGREDGDRRPPPSAPGATIRKSTCAPVRAADPVALHRQHALGPVALQRRHVVQQPVGVVGDLEVPLGQVALGDLVAAALAAAVDDLLVGQHGLVVRAPVDRRGLAVGQPPLQEAQEQPLRPAVVLGVAGVQPPAPVEADAEAAERLGLGLDVGVGPLRGVLVALDRRVLRGQPEGVPADRVQHVVAAQHPVARDDVADRERLGVAHVQVAGGVREHVQHVLLRPAGHRGPAAR